MLQEGLPAVGLIPRKLWMAITTFSIRSSQLTVSPTSSLQTAVLFSPIKRKTPHLSMRIPIHSLPMPVNSWGWTGIKQCASGKGRVERLNQTLQSRLPVELRLAGITTIDAANEFLNSYIKEFNEKFSLPIHGIKSVFEVQPQIEKINLILAVLCERTVDTGHCLRHSNKYYRMIDSRGNQVHYRKGTKVMFIQAFDGSQYCCVNDKDIYALEEIPEHETKSKDLDIDYTPPKPKKPRIPPMNHPWRRQQFGKFVKQQEHHQNDQDTKIAWGMKRINLTSPSKKPGLILQLF